MWIAFLNPFFLNPDYLSIIICDFPLIARSRTSHVYHFDWVHAAHLKYMSMVLKKLRIIGIWMRKN